MSTTKNNILPLVHPGNILISFVDDQDAEVSAGTIATSEGVEEFGCMSQLRELLEEQLGDHEDGTGSFDNRHTVDIEADGSGTICPGHTYPGGGLAYAYNTPEELQRAVAVLFTGKVLPPTSGEDPNRAYATPEIEEACTQPRMWELSLRVIEDPDLGPRYALIVPGRSKSCFEDADTLAATLRNLDVRKLPHTPYKSK